MGKQSIHLYDGNLVNLQWSHVDSVLAWVVPLPSNRSPPGWDGIPRCSCAQRAIAYIRSAVSKCGGTDKTHSVGSHKVVGFFGENHRMIEKYEKWITWQVVVFWDERWKLNYWGLDKIRGTSSPWSIVILPNPRFQKKSFAPLYRSFLSQYFIFSMIFSSQTPFWTPQPPSLTFVYFPPSSHFPGTCETQLDLGELL